MPMPKSVSTQDIRQVSVGHYTGEGAVMDDPWPLLRARGLGLFHGEGMRINIEELNKLVLYAPLFCAGESVSNGQDVYSTVYSGTTGGFD